MNANDKGYTEILTRPHELSYNIVGHDKGASYEMLRQAGGMIWSVAGIKPEGRSPFRGGRMKSIHEIEEWMNHAQDRLMLDVQGRKQLTKQREHTANFAVDLAQSNVAIATLLVDKALLLVKDKDTRFIDKKIEELEQGTPQLILPPPADLNVMPDAEYAFLKSDLVTMHLRIRGYPRHGGPYWRRWEVAIEEYAISLSLNSGNHDPLEGRFQERRADINRDTTLDIVALRVLDRMQADPTFDIRKSVDSVMADYYSHSLPVYEEWLQMIRGGITERNELAKKYSAPKDNPFGVTIPPGKAYETLVNHIVTDDFNTPDVKKWGEVIESIRKRYGDKPVSSDVFNAHFGIKTHSDKKTISDIDPTRIISYVDRLQSNSEQEYPKLPRGR